jgi:hypothetical protein
MDGIVQTEQSTSIMDVPKLKGVVRKIYKSVPLEQIAPIVFTKERPRR